MVTTSEQETSVEYTIPEGCPVCAGDLQVKVSDAGARGVCLTCNYFARPTVGVTHKGLRVDLTPVADA